MPDVLGLAGDVDGSARPAAEARIMLVALDRIRPAELPLDLRVLLCHGGVRPLEEPQRLHLFVDRGGGRVEQGFRRALLISHGLQAADVNPRGVGQESEALIQLVGACGRALEDVAEFLAGGRVVGAEGAGVATRKAHHAGDVVRVEPAGGRERVGDAPGVSDAQARGLSTGYGEAIQAARGQAGCVPHAGQGVILLLPQGTDVGGRQVGRGAESDHGCRGHVDGRDEGGRSRCKATDAFGKLCEKAPHAAFGLTHRLKGDLEAPGFHEQAAEDVAAGRHLAE